MSNARLFTAIYISEIPFVNGVLMSNKSMKYNFQLLESKKTAETLYHSHLLFYRRFGG